MTILDRLFKLKDENYADFSASLTPTINRELFIGVRVPQIRKLAKEIEDSTETKEFLNKLPHHYFDENMLHAILISNIKDFDICLNYVEKFLPYVDNWNVCDILVCKALSKNKYKLLNKIKEWLKSDKPYTIRFGIGILMRYYLDIDFKKEYLDLVSSIRSEEYYVKMMIAWFVSTALVKQWDSTIKIIENQKLDKWCHNKAIQKAIESYRITSEQKIYLRNLKIK